MNWLSQSATRWGGTVGVGWEYGFAPNWSAGIEYDHLFMGHANNSFTSTNHDRCRFPQQPDQSGRGLGHLAHQLSLRRLRWPGRREVLISRYFDFSSKLGRQKCRPFLLKLGDCHAARRANIARGCRPGPRRGDTHRRSEQFHGTSGFKHENLNRLAPTSSPAGQRNENLRSPHKILALVHGTVR